MLRSAFIRLRPTTSNNIHLSVVQWRVVLRRRSSLLGAACVFTSASILTHNNVRRCCNCEGVHQTRWVEDKNGSRAIHIDQTKFKLETWWLQRLRERIKSTVFVIWRGVEIVVMFSPLVILAPTAYILSYANELWNSLCGYTTNEPILLTSGYTADEQSTKTTDELFEDSYLRHKINHNKTFISNITWSYTLFTLQYLGPAFVKLGQWAATRRDLFPLHFCIQLSALHSHARTHAFVHTHKALVDSFGEDYESRGLILNDDDIILGSGSVAQVYKATLKNSTTDETKTVAVKVLHPNIRTRTERDLALMQNIANLIDRCIPLQSVKMLSLPRAVANFADLMRRQVDLRVEGDNLDVFRENFKSSSVVRFAEPQRGWVSEQVLVEEYIGDGARPISDFLEDDSVMGLKERKTLARTFVSSALKMVFTDNFVHSDLHPGNVLVQGATTTGKITKYEITFLDAGIAMSLKPNDRKNLHDLFKAVVLNDGYTAGRLMVERARYERCSSVPGGTEKFASGVQDIVSEFHDKRKQGLTLGAVKIGALLAKVLDLCRIYQVEIDPAMSSIVISMMVLEGLGRSLDPDLNLIKSAIPFLLGKV